MPSVARCSRCDGRLFTEHTPDGVERVCLNGHRFTAVVPLPIPADDPYASKRGPRSEGRKI